MTRRIYTPFVLVATAILIVCAGVQTGDGFGGTAGVNEPILGGKMYDKWWVVIGMDPPAGDHPLYPPEGTRSGSTTFRCKECHGWDYKGAAGAYGKGSSHFTGIPGILDSTMTPAEMFEVISLDEGAIANGHGYSDYGMNDQDIFNIIEFLQTLLIDTDIYINENDEFIGDEKQGEFNYTKAGMPSCVNCHGPNGDWLNFHDPEDPEWVGTVAVENPWEFIHKARFGQPATSMPSWIEGGGDTQGVVDIGRYAQLNFPTELCPSDLTGDWTVSTTDLLELFAQWGTDGPADLDESGAVGTSDLLILFANWGQCG